jgi:hypothetical protein
VDDQPRVAGLAAGLYGVISVNPELRVLESRPCGLTSVPSGTEEAPNLGTRRIGRILERRLHKPQAHASSGGKTVFTPFISPRTNRATMRKVFQTRES